MEFVGAAVEVATGLSQLRHLAAETTDNITDQWYQASKDMEDFKELQTKLHRKSEIWKDALRSAGMSEERSVTEPLFDAIKCLEGEKKKIDRIQSRCCLLFLFRAQPFPPLLKDSMKKVVDAFDDIPSAFGERGEPARILENFADSRPDSYQIVVDGRTVELADTEGVVKRHINDVTGKQVVTLYGGPGSGKTSLAKSVGRYYQENKTIFSDGARFLPCGRNATVDSICKELFQSLGFSDATTGSAPEAKVEQAHKSKGTPSEGQSSSMSLIKKLPRRLKERHLLIILDDVSDPDLLKEKLIVPQAKYVKYLITSQEKDIYDGAAVIHMKRPTDLEAMMILGNHVPGLSNGEFPDHLQEIVIQIIRKADGHPMILATIGGQVDDFDDESSWVDVLKYFNTILSSKRTSGDMLATSMLMAVDTLRGNRNALKLLYLMAICEPLSVPQVVLQFLFRHIDPKHFDSNHLSTFKMLGKILKDRDLIVVEQDEWVLSSTYQYFILKNKKEDVSELLCTLMKEDSDDGDDELVRALCILYIVSKKDTFTPAATSALESAALKFNIPLKDQDMISNMRKTIKPFIYLLFPLKEGDECEIRRHRLVSKAIMLFISKQALDDESFAQLLDEEDIYKNICEVLVNMTSVQKEEPILTKDTFLTLKALIFNLTPTSKDIVTTVDTLSRLSHLANCDLILENVRVLRNLLKILRSGDDEEKQISVLVCLSALAQSSTARKKIASCEGLIEALVAIFYMESNIIDSDNMMMKTHSIYALGFIALHDETSTKLVKTLDLLTSIARFLDDIYFGSKDQDFILKIGHSGARSTIQCLLSLLKGNDENKGYISKHEDLMQVLAKIFEIFNNKEIDYDNNLESYYTKDDVVEVALEVLTLIDPLKYNDIILYSKKTFVARGDSNAFLGKYEQAFEDYRMADRFDNFNECFYKTHLCFFKAMLEEYEEAALYAKLAIEAKPNDQFVWQESGVLKRLMGDYEGAKVDLNKALELNPNDYEVLKHRAYVNFKLGCEEEAHKDAQKALQIIPKYRIDRHDYGRGGCLGYLSISKFLDYDLM